VDLYKRIRHFVSQPSVCLRCSISDLFQFRPEAVNVSGQCANPFRKGSMPFFLFSCHYYNSQSR
jgi:hypothetical protein